MARMALRSASNFAEPVALDAAKAGAETAPAPSDANIAAPAARRVSINDILFFPQCFLLELVADRRAVIGARLRIGVADAGICRQAANIAPPPIFLVRHLA